MSFDPQQIHVKPFLHETRKMRSLHFSIAEVQSCMDLSRPDSLELAYTRTMMGFLLFHPAPLRIGMIGLGGGSLAKFCYRHLPRADISVLEINPHVIALRNDFAVPADDDRFRVLRADGARYIRAHEGAFDVLLVDGYDSDGLPGALSSKRFYDDVAHCLRPSGVMAANIHLGTAEFALLVTRVGRSFNGAALAVKEQDSGNAVVFARKDCKLTSCELEDVTCPKTLEAVQWNRLQQSFGRIRAASNGGTP
ncbi:MAG: Spermine synthase [Rhizobacter sp.]|nr:Spermine synthase [Rhizobacter sp.]